VNRIEEPERRVDYPPSAPTNHDQLKQGERPGSGSPDEIKWEKDEPGPEKVPTTVKEGTGLRLVIAVVIVFLVLALGFIIAFFVRSRNESHAQQTSTDSSDAIPGVDVVTVVPTASTYPLVLPGQTAGWFESAIYARVDGYLGEWFSDIGDPVKAGQVLATIETPELDQQLGAAQARANVSTAQMRVASANESIAQITYDRWWKSPPEVVSEQERQEKKATYDSSVAQLEAAKAQHELDEAEVNRLKALESFKQVVAPYDGVITGRHIDIGDLVTLGSSSVTTSLYTIAQPNVIRTFIDVPQKLADQMEMGLDAIATSDQFPGIPFRGKVARSTRSIDPQSRTQRTEVDIPNDDKKHKNHVLVPGMYVQVTFQLHQRGLVQVPAASIIFKPGGLQVAVIDDQDKVEFRPITVTKDNGDTVELNSGVKEGEHVALNISNYIVAGEKVNPVNVDKERQASEAAPPPAPSVEGSGPAADTESPPNYTPAPYSGIHPPAPATVPTQPVQSSAPPVIPYPSSRPVTEPSDPTPSGVPAIVAPPTSEPATP